MWSFFFTLCRTWLQMVLKDYVPHSKRLTLRNIMKSLRTSWYHCGNICVIAILFPYVILNLLHVTKNWLRQFNVLPSLAYSWGLNPIQNLWTIKKKKLQVAAPKINVRFISRIKSIVSSLLITVLKSFVTSLSSRVHAVVKCKDD